MVIDINDCDLNEDYFHFTNKANVNSILTYGLKPRVGAASQMVGDSPNVSVSQGAKGIMGIINSYIYMFANTQIKNIPETYKKYFSDIKDFSSEELVGKTLASRAMIRKLKDEVYFRVIMDKSKLDNAVVGGLTEFDIKISESIDKGYLTLVGYNGTVIDAYQFVEYIYQKAKDVEIFRELNSDFFNMFEDEKITSLQSEEIGCSR